MVGIESVIRITALSGIRPLMSGLQVAEFFNQSIQSIRKTLGDAMRQKVALAFHLYVKYGEGAFPTQSGKLP
jgi:hypothetical protein